MFLQFLFQFEDADPAQVADLFRIRVQFPFILSKEYMIQFIFRQIAEIFIIGKVKQLIRIHIDPQFLPRAADHGIPYPLTFPRVRTAGIAPQTGGMVFPFRSLLQQHIPMLVRDEQRKGTMQFFLPVCFHLFRAACFLIKDIHQDNIVVHFNPSEKKEAAGMVIMPDRFLSFPLFRSRSFCARRSHPNGR